MSMDQSIVWKAAALPCALCGLLEEPRPVSRPSLQSDDLEDEYFWDVVPSWGDSPPREARRGASAIGE